jgi:hypothetical protein
MHDRKLHLPYFLVHRHLGKLLQYEVKFRELVGIQLVERRHGQFADLEFFSKVLGGCPQIRRVEARLVLANVHQRSLDDDRRDALLNMANLRNRVEIRLDSSRFPFLLVGRSSDDLEESAILEHGGQRECEVTVELVPVLASGNFCVSVRVNGGGGGGGGGGNGGGGGGNGGGGRCKIN